MPIRVRKDWIRRHNEEQEKQNESKTEERGQHSTTYTDADVLNRYAEMSQRKT